MSERTTEDMLKQYEEKYQAEVADWQDAFNRIFPFQKNPNPDAFIHQDRGYTDEEIADIHENAYAPDNEYIPPPTVLIDTGPAFDWNMMMGMNGGTFSGQLIQPTAELYDASKAAKAGKFSMEGWDAAWVDKFRLNAADPPYIDGTYLDNFLREQYPDSPLIGYGGTIKEMSDWFGIAVGMAYGVWAKESTFGRAPCGGDYNFGCVKWSSKWGFPMKPAAGSEWIDPPNVRSSVIFWFKYVRENYLNQGITTYKDFLNKYSPSFENDQGTFKNYMWGTLKAFGYDTADRVSKINYSTGNEDPMTFQVPVQQNGMAGGMGNYTGAALSYSGHTISAQHVNTIAGLAKQHNILPSILITMLHYEGLWGSSNVARTDNNWGGMTWTGDGNRPSGVVVTRGSARPSGEGGYYMRYRSVDEFFRDWVYLLRPGGNYVVSGKTNFEQAARGLFRAGGAKVDYAATNMNEYVGVMTQRRSGINSQNNGVMDTLDRGGSMPAGGVAAGGGFPVASGGMFQSFPTIPNKSQINHGYASPGYPSHRGIDIIYTDGSSQIFAVGAGNVVEVTTGCSVGNSSCGGGWGNYTRIQHPNGYSTLYAHLSSVGVRKGQSVRAGQVIGQMGNTGNSTGKHLHLELWDRSSNRIDPERHLSFTGYKRLFG